MRVLVCGGRNWKDYQLVYDALRELRREKGIDFLMAGDARGVDAAALSWAKMAGVSNACFSACWDAHGKAAGPIRNADMLKYGEPDLVIAFPGGRGTADTVRKAKGMGIEVREINDG